MGSATEFVRSGVIELFARVALVLVGLGALLLVLVGAWIAGIPRKGREFSTAFLHVLPLATVLLISLGVVAELADPEDVRFSQPCHLAGNYSLMMVDAESPGWVYKDTNGFQNINWNRDGIDGVKSLQINGKYIVGGRDARGFQKNAIVNEYLLIDTDTLLLTRFATRSQLESAVTSLGIRVQLKPAYDIYSENQQPESVVLEVVACILGVLSLGLFFLWARKLKSLRPTAVVA